MASYKLKTVSNRSMSEHKTDIDYALNRYLISNLGKSGTTITSSDKATSDPKQYIPPAAGKPIKGGPGNTYFIQPQQNSSKIQDIVLQAHGDGWTVNNEDYVNFNRYYAINLADESPSGKHYVFFCRPDLYLLDVKGNWYTLSTKSRVAQDSFFQKLAYEDPMIIRSLTAEFADSNVRNIQSTFAAPSQSGYGNSTTTDGTRDANGVSLSIHSLIPFLTGRVESIQLPDYSIKTFSLTQPYTKYSLPMSLTSIESTTGGSFDVSFREDGNFSITKMFYAWIRYMDGVMRNEYSPKAKYQKYNALDYATSVYDIIVDPTGTEIKFFGKYTGVIPTAVPLSDHGFNKSGGSSGASSVNISFQYFHYEPLNPEILLDFNYNSLGYIYMENAGKYRVFDMRSCPLPYMDTYDSNYLSAGRPYVGRPYVVQDTQRRKFFLRWMPPV